MSVELSRHQSDMDNKESSLKQTSVLPAVPADEYIAPNLAQHEDDFVKAEIGFKSWLAVFACLIATFAQIYVIVGAASVIAFIARDLGAVNVGWIIQAPVLVQAVLCPVIGRLSDLKDRKWIATTLPLISAAGAAICARAGSIDQIIGGSVMIGVAISTVSIINAIPSETLPLKWRALSNGLVYISGNLGGLLGTLGAGGITKALSWRWIYWLQLILHVVTSLSLLFFYKPPKRLYPKLSFRQLLWAVDTIGCVLFISGSVLTLLALNWAGSAYPWKSAHVISTFIIGILLLVAFGVYEAVGRNDGIVAHVLFKGNRNFFLALFAFSIEGYLYFGSVSQYMNQVVLNLGFQTDPLLISVRSLVWTVTGLIGSAVIITYTTKTKDLKTPLLVCFSIFLVATILYGTIKPTADWDRVQLWANNITSGLGQSGPLILIITLLQFCAPHAYLATATGLAYSARAIGGAFGSAIMGAVINGELVNVVPEVAGAAVAAGLPPTSIEALISCFYTGAPFSIVPGITPQIIGAAASTWARIHAHAYNLGYLSIIPFIAIAMVCIVFLTDVKHLMTEHVQAPVEEVHKHHELVKRNSAEV